MCVKVTPFCPTLWPNGLYSPWNSPGQNTGVGICSLLQGIFPTQGGIELGSPALQADSLPAEPPLILFDSGNWLLYCIGELLNVILGCLLFPHNSLQIISFSKNTIDVMFYSVQAWHATVHGVAKSRTQQSDWTDCRISISTVISSATHLITLKYL